MFGADTAPLRTSNKIRFKNGSIECSKKGSESAGFALLWPVDGFGRTLLSTTRLPERKRPYNLNVELARARLMQITLKREDWSLFEEETNSFAGLAHQAQELFIEALQNIADSPKASVLADESLKKALVFSEKLATKHAELFVAAKCKNKVLGRHSLGCRIDPHLIDNAKYRKRLFDMFGYVTIYCHLSKFLVKVGQKVKRGETIGLVGSTGKARGPHVHYEVQLNSKEKNPYNYLLEE